MALERRTTTRSVMIAIAVVLQAVLAGFGSPLLAQDSDAATREFRAAVALQNSEAYDVAAKAWGKFIDANPADSRVNHARHYQGVCYFRTAVAAADAKQTDAARRAFDAAEADFAEVVKVPALRSVGGSVSLPWSDTVQEGGNRTGCAGRRMLSLGGRITGRAGKELSAKQVFRPRRFTAAATVPTVQVMRTPRPASIERPSRSRPTRRSSRKSCMPWA